MRRVWDALWLRVLDVPGALAARSYAVDGSVTIGVKDDLYPDNDGTYKVISDGGESHCERVADDPDLHMDVASLGAIYLGGRRLGTMARAGHVHGTAEAVREADAFFSWDPAPWCPEVF